jgi:hypothetical protein
LIVYKELNFGHGTFTFGKDSSFWTDEIFPLIEKITADPYIVSKMQESPKIEELPLFESPPVQHYIKSQAETLFYNLIKNQINKKFGIDLDIEKSNFTLDDINTMDFEKM